MIRIFTFILGLLFCSTTIYSQTQSLSESVEYDPINNRFLSGNDAVSMIQQDTMGNLSYFGQGLPSNLGIEIIGNNVFCIVATSQTDPIRIINVYDLTTETLVTSYTISDASLLNGMASDGISKIWLTDFQNSSIYEIDFTNVMQPIHTKLVDDNAITNSPNGIVYDETQNRLVFVSWSDDKIRALDLADNSISIVLDNSGIDNMDGIDMDANDNFYVSSWSPNSRITKYSNDFSTSEILNIPGVSNPADICVAKEINMLAIPSFQHNVIFWRLENIMTSTSEIINKSIKISSFPNPSNGIFKIKLEEQLWNEVKCQIFDPVGRIIHNTTFQNYGNNEFQIDLSQEQYRGSYIMTLTIDKKETLSKMIHKL